MKVFFNKLKIIWKDPRGRALLQIGLYGLFFGILFLLLNIKTSSNTRITPEERYERWNHYRYKMIIQKENEVYHLDGYQKDYDTFLVEEQNHTYKITDDGIMDENETIISTFDWSLFSPRKLASFIRNGTINSTTNYKDGSKRIEYEMDCKLWNSKEEGLCHFETKQKEGKIVQVILRIENKYSLEIDYNEEFPLS